jgi:RNA polymerase sigma factor (sigma-70 family)
MRDLKIEAQFNSILVQYGKLLRNAIVYHCPEEIGLDVDDVMQEACLRLWRAVSSEREIRDPASYLQRIAATAAIDAIRRVKARREEQMHLSPDEASGSDAKLEQPIDTRTSPESAAQHRELMLIVEAVLGSLPENRSRVVRLHLQGFSTLEIAELMAWSEAKTRNLVYRGLDDLRSRLRAHGFDYEVE